MNNILIKIHTEPFDKINTFSPYDTNRNCERAKQNTLMAEKSAELTTDIAIKFAEWLNINFYFQIDNIWYQHKDTGDGDLSIEVQKTTQKLFDYFINNVYGK